VAIKWVKTAHKGLRYYIHQTRRHGKKKDRYYSIRFKVDKKDYSYGIGWWSEGIPEEARRIDPNMGFEEYCLSQLRLYKANVKAGSGAKTPKEKRKFAKEVETQKKLEETQRAKEAISFEKFFTDIYLPQAKADKKERSVTREEGLFKTWIAPILGSLPLKDIFPFPHLEKLKRDMIAGGLSQRSIIYALAVVRQVFNQAKKAKVFTGENPTSGVKLPKPDNGRMRFLTHDEADKLLEALARRSTEVYDMSLLSLHSGLRFGEIVSLTWQDVDLERGILTVRDAKAGSRYAFLTDQAIRMLKTLIRGEPSDLIFPDRSKKKKERISKIFPLTVAALKLNDGIEDPRLKICFHSLRHTYASWMIEQGQDLYTVQKLLGHKTAVMTQRYVHLTENKLKDAAKKLSMALQKKDDDKVKEIEDWYGDKEI
jgi:integrase